MRKKNVISIVVLIVAFMVLNAKFVSYKNMTRNGYVGFDLYGHDHHQDHYPSHHYHTLNGRDHQYPAQIRKNMEDGAPHLDNKCQWEPCNFFKQDCEWKCACIPFVSRELAWDFVASYHYLPDPNWEIGLKLEVVLKFKNAKKIAHLIGSKLDSLARENYLLDSKDLKYMWYGTNELQCSSQNYGMGRRSSDAHFHKAELVLECRLFRALYRDGDCRCCDT
ncbi:hypothetical protein FNV43_RR27090 [Rhamnella rubrinervis]|uniref:Uncharacterized protein n=1 Tax=Rhamnella rubrinervis TaxID=2594499 RepID=A0A8K0DJY6_9ROSA|nr:hypothetical protein FNV43_RR27090 [Rhamnella rubrinervis]